MSLLQNLDRVVIRRISVSEMNNNVYLITARATGTQVLIDAADDSDAIKRMLDDAAADSPEPTRLELIVTTHQHLDHIRALADSAASSEAQLAAGEDDVAEIEQRTGVTITRRLQHGDSIDVDGFSLNVIHLRGHTDGSVALAYTGDGPTHLFTGDSLFPGGVGNTNGDAERFVRLHADVSERLFDAYPDDTLVHPGHGDGTTLGAERPHLAEWLKRGW